MISGDLTALGAADIADRVHQGVCSAVDVARAHLARIAERDPRARAFVAADPERVLREAEHVDRRPDRFALPLAGVPVAVADDVDVGGHPTRHGSAATRPDPATRDDELVKRLRAAGALVVGKTRTRALGVLADDPGADCGAALAVAEGMVVLALGTDGGGGLRLPAARHGLVAVKPGSDVVALPRRADRHWLGLSATGVLARSARDAGRALGVLCGTTLELDLPGPARIAVSLHHPRGRRLPDDQRAAVVGAAARLRAGTGGAVVDLADPPYTRGLARQWTRRFQAGVADEVAAIVVDPGLLEAGPAAVARRGRRVQRLTPPRDRAAAAWRERVLSWFDTAGHDLVVLPADDRAAGDRAPFLRPWNLAGLPAVVVPVLVAGRPVGVQLVGRPGAEALLLATAALVEGRPVPVVGAATPRTYSFPAAPAESAEPAEPAARGVPVAHRAPAAPTGSGPPAPRPAPDGPRSRMVPARLIS